MSNPFVIYNKNSIIFVGVCFFLMNLDDDRYRWLRINAGISDYVPLTNTDTDSTGATDSPCVSGLFVLGL